MTLMIKMNGKYLQIFRSEKFQRWAKKLLTQKYGALTEMMVKWTILHKDFTSSAKKHEWLWFAVNFFQKNE